MRKICVITGTRADYGLLYWVIKKISHDSELSLRLIATGMHLSPEFGNTYNEIINDGFEIDEKCEVLLSSDSNVGISKSIGLGVISFSEIYAKLQPDIILVLGDRFEIFAAVTAAMIAKIPIAHCHGGEATYGLIDEPIRHSITKMSHIHFPSTEDYKKRIIQLGEDPKRVFNVGGLGIENIKKLNLLSKTDFEKSVNFKLDKKKTLLVTFHPVTLDNNSSEHQIKELLKAIDEVSNCKIIFTKSNADTNGRIINSMIDNYVNNNSKKAIAFNSLGQLRYLSALQYVDVVLGNSSSGLLEVPSFKKPTINIGDRQAGRIKATSVVDCESNYKSIRSSFEKVFSTDFQINLKNTKNPYDNGNSSDKIIHQLKVINLNNIVKKEFYDI